ncbi:hypothetical protein [Enterococcus sp. AZ163]|uniref:hypothetical protein n=1 Tax=Enterococcus sp. AZ163 TaxID=2774638 RepID=UPI003D2B60C7
MKKFIGMILVLMVLLTGCGGATADKQEKEEKPAKTAEAEKKGSTQAKKSAKETEERLSFPLSTSQNDTSEFVKEDEITKDTFKPKAYFHLGSDLEVGNPQWIYFDTEENKPKKYTKTGGLLGSKAAIEELEAIPSSYMFLVNDKKEGFGGYIYMYDVKAENDFEKNFPEYDGLYMTKGNVEISKKLPDLKDQFNWEVKDIDSGEGKVDGVPYKYAYINFTGEYSTDDAKMYIVFEIDEETKVFVEVTDYGGKMKVNNNVEKAVERFTDGFELVQ